MIAHRFFQTDTHNWISLEQQKQNASQSTPTAILELYEGKKKFLLSTVYVVRKSEIKKAHDQAGQKGLNFFLERPFDLIILFTFKKSITIHIFKEYFRTKTTFSILSMVLVFSTQTF